MDKNGKRSYLEGQIAQSQDQLFASDVEIEAKLAEGKLAESDAEKEMHNFQVANQKKNSERLKVRIASYKKQLSELG